MLLESVKHSQQPSTKPTVMVVDDDSSALMLINLMLSRAGFDVILCSDADDALSQLEQTTPDAFILDVNMPITDGVLLCKMLRARTESALKPILLLSARTEPAIVASGLAAGADDYLVKPVMNHDLVQKVRALLTLQ